MKFVILGMFAAASGLYLHGVGTTSDASTMTWVLLGFTWTASILMGLAALPGVVFTVKSRSARLQYCGLAALASFAILAGAPLAFPVAESATVETVHFEQPASAVTP